MGNGTHPIYLKSMSHDSDALISAALDRDGELSRHRLVLYAGANLPAREVRDAYAPGLGAMPSMGPSFDKEQPGTELVSRFEVAVREKACALFGAQWAEPRLPSATLANLALFHAFARPGDRMLAPSPAHGGHLSQRRGGTPELAGLVCEDLPFDTSSLCLDSHAAAYQVRERRLRLVMLGRSVMVRPDDIAPVTAAAREMEATVIFDGSHVAGLIAGGAYPNPREEGADILVTSTYKTIPGMPHGLVLGRNPAQGESLARLLDARFLANYNPAMLPPLLRLLERMHTHAHAYAARIVASTEALCAACRERGLPVIAPPSEHTHQMLIPIAVDEKPRVLIDELARRHIIIGTAADPTREGAKRAAGRNPVPRYARPSSPRHGACRRSVIRHAHTLAARLATGDDAGTACGTSPADRRASRPVLSEGSPALARDGACRCVFGHIRQAGAVFGEIRFTDTAPAYCFYASSSGGPETTSLENALMPNARLLPRAHSTMKSPHCRMAMHP